MNAVECGGCLRAYTRADWDALPLVRTLTSLELEHVVVAWQAARVIEVRECQKCGHPMARATGASLALRGRTGPRADR